MNKSERHNEKTHPQTNKQHETSNNNNTSTKTTRNSKHISGKTRENNTNPTKNQKQQSEHRMNKKKHKTQTRVKPRFRWGKICFLDIQEKTLNPKTVYFFVPCVSFCKHQPGRGTRRMGR